MSIYTHSGTKIEPHHGSVCYVYRAMSPRVYMMFTCEPVSIFAIVATTTSNMSDH